jgi:hypothetical protein
MSDTLLPKIGAWIEQKHIGIKICLLAGAFLALLSSDTLLNINAGIFRFIGGATSHIPYVWIVLALIYFVCVIGFIWKTFDALQKRTEEIFRTVFLFAVIFVSAGTLHNLVPHAPGRIIVITQLISALIAAPLFAVYSGRLLFFFAPYQKSLIIQFLCYFWSLSFFGLGMYFFGITMLALF